MANPFCHLQLSTPDADAAKRFYAALFGWEMSDVPMADGVYTMINPGEGPGGGIRADGQGPAGWLTYVQVPDVAEAAARAASLGAKVLQPVTAVPGMGSLAVLADPTGGVIGLWQGE